MRYFILLSLSLISFLGLSNKTASEIYVDLQKLHSLKRVLYIAAHPDDENTRALAYFSLGEKAETAYLSLTRGDGGQNLIGNELGQYLGVLRTQELLAARSFDGARQFFTRAVDFGYSRTAEESFEKWGKDEILSDVVYVIRKFRPDVIITRFPPDSRAGHGHHTASAMLAIEAFDKAADSDYKILKGENLDTWKTKSVYWNASTWWNPDLDSIAKTDDSYLVQDIGGYNAQLGMSYNEIGTIARSQHKCQGFGAVIERGSRKEYFQLLTGAKLKDTFFEEDEKSWEKLISKDFANRFNSLLNEFDFIHLENNIKPLIALQTDISKLEDSEFKTEKIDLINQIIIDCMGLYIEAVGNDYAFVQGEEFNYQINLINRSSIQVSIDSYETPTGNTIDVGLVIGYNETFEKEVSGKFSNDLSGPYWLKGPFENLFEVQNNSDLGEAQQKPILEQKITLTIEGQEINTTIPVTYKWRDPSYGERRRNVICAPRFSVNLEQTSLISKIGEVKTIRLKIHAFEENLNETIRLIPPNGWGVNKNEISFKLANKHDEVWLEFTMTPTANAERGMLKIVDAQRQELSLFSYTEIIYDHIPTQIIYTKAALECIELDAKIIPGKVAYIKGVDDAVPQAIEQLGFEVKVFEVADLATTDLAQFQSVVLGIRIYNVHPELENYHDQLYGYVENGGNLIMQYNTASRSKKGKKFGPKPFELSRNRVTEEDAEVTFLDKDHQIMTHPNKLSQKDFDNWVQERGLYFANNWDKSYTPLFSWHDKDEDPVEGALIVTKHGKGQFIYTGISFFRELPNGVEGAYRLFANMLSYKASE